MISGCRLKRAGVVLGARVGRTSRAASARKYDVVRCWKGESFVVAGAGHAIETEAPAMKRL